MFPLFETLCVKDGKVLHEAFHVKRFRASYRTHFGSEPPYDLLEGLRFSEASFEKGHLYRLRIDYGREGRSVQLRPYVKKPVCSLRLLTDNAISYHLKYSDRRALERLFALRASCDDVLIVKNGRITDTTFCNIAFFDGSRWLTPSAPLLRGTARQRLLEEGILFEAEIRPKDLALFSVWKVFNALRSFEEAETLPIDRIVGEQ